MRKGTAGGSALGSGEMVSVHHGSMEGSSMGQGARRPGSGGGGVLLQMRSTMWMRGVLLVVMP